MTTPYTTTLSALRAADACQRGYDLIANRVGRDFDGPIRLETILDNNGLDDAIWALRATDGGKELAVAFAIYCAEPYYTDPAWIEWARKWMSGEDRSTSAARAAAAYAADAAGAAAYATARAADAAYAYAADAAWAAARAAWAAARAAWATARAADAAADAAGAAAYAAARAADAADAAAAERKRQADILRRLVRGEGRRVSYLTTIGENHV